MEIADKNTRDFRPKACSEVTNISREITQKGKSKFNNQNRIENPKQVFRCFRCGGSHAPNLCKFKDEKCYLCLKKGHIAKVCQSKSSNNKTFKPRRIEWRKLCRGRARVLWSLYVV